jgi:hypothetical protein
MLETIESPDDIETRLRACVSSVDLIAELQLTESDVDKLRRIVRAEFDRYEIPRGIRTLEQRWRHITVCFLVWQGIGSYRGGDFWSGVRRSQALCP